MQSRAVLRPLAAAAAATLLTAMGATAPAVAGGAGDDDQRGKSAEASVKVEEKHGDDDEQRGNSAEASVKVEEKHGDDDEQRGNSGSAPGTSKSSEAKAAKNGAAEHEDGQKNDAAATAPDHSQGNASTEGEYDEPQPESNADKNDGGANAGTCGTETGGPYCSTRDGTESKNGKGDGEATGRPAAGTVGKADNKNPPGQLPGPDNDGNRGYECDQPGDKPNQGIAEGNPAHSACVEAVVTPPKEEKPKPPKEEKPKPPKEEKPKPPKEEKPEQPKPEQPKPEQPKPEQPKPDEEVVVVVTPVTPQPNAPVTPVVPPEQQPEAPVVLPVEQEVQQPAPVVQPGPEAFPAQQVAGVSGQAAPTSYQTTGTLPATGAEEHTLLVAVGLGMTFIGLVVLTRRRVQPQQAPVRRR